MSLGLSVALTSTRGETIFDDFNDGNDTSPGWMFIDPAGNNLATRSFPNGNSCRLNGPAAASVRPDFVFTDGEVRVELTDWNSISVGSSVGMLVRFQGNNSGYFLSLDLDGDGTSMRLSLVKLVQGADLGAGAEGALINYDPGKVYILQTVAAGAQLICRIFEKGASGNVQLDSFTWTDDSGPYLAGATGLLVANNDFPDSLAAAAATFDNFLATDGEIAQPVITNLFRDGDNLWFGVVAEAGRPYVVEYQTDLNSTEWQLLASIPQSSHPDTWPILSQFQPDNRFFRVKSPPLTLP